MQTSLQTSRLILRPIEKLDAEGLFALDSNPDVHIFLGRNPVKSMDVIDEIIDSIQGQYIANGMGRWAIIDKETGEFLGWSGLKLEKDVNGRTSFYDFGYRLRQEFWGKGIATEAGQAWIDYGFEVMKLPVINAFVSADNVASRRVLEKCGLEHTEDFEYDGGPECWYEIRNPKR